jgi:hypothetical protein
LFRAAEIVDTEAPAALATSRIVTCRRTRLLFAFNAFLRTPAKEFHPFRFFAMFPKHFGIHGDNCCRRKFNTDGLALASDDPASRRRKDNTSAGT